MPDERTPHEGNLAPGARRGIIKRGRAVARASWDAIFERKRAEEALRESETRFRDLVENTSDIVWEMDVNGVYTYCSPNVASILGYEPEELIGKTPFDFMPPEEARRVGDLFGTIVAERRPFSLLAHQTRYKDGRMGVMECSGRPVFDEHGQLAGYRGVDRDISERKRAEEALRDSEEKYRHLVENINDVIYQIDASGRVAYISPVIEQLTGYSPAEVIGRSFIGFIHPDDFAPLMENFQRNLTRNPEPNEYRILSKSGEAYWVRSLGQPIFQGGHAVGFRGVLTDITERKRMEDALQAAREELEAKVERQMLRRNPYGLTFRELTVLHLVAAGESDREIGVTLAISHLTAQKHVSNILAKMEAASRTGAVARALREGLLD